MKRLGCVLACVALASIAVAGEKCCGEKKGKACKAGDGDLIKCPVEVFKKVDTAAKAVKVVRYEVKVEATGAFKKSLDKYEATCMLRGTDTRGQGYYLPENWHVDAKFNLPGTEKFLRLTGGGDGENYYVVDHAGRTAYEDMDEAVLGPAAGAFRVAWMIEFIHPAPFTDEIKAKKHEMQGIHKIAGVECYQIHVSYDDARSSEATWWIGTKDFLPRQRLDYYTMPDGSKATRTRTLSKLEVDPKLGENGFSLKLPDGYMKTDDFATTAIFHAADAGESNADAPDEKHKREKKDEREREETKGKK